MPRFRQQIKELFFKNKLEEQTLDMICTYINNSSHSALEIGATLKHFKKSKNHKSD